MKFQWFQQNYFCKSTRDFVKSLDSIPFAGKTIIVSGNLYQLLPVLAKPVFVMDGFIEKTLKLWHNFKLAELNETMRQ